MRHRRDSNSLCIVLQAAKQELERSANYAERIIALRNTAKILHLLTGYQGLAQEIEFRLSVAGNFSSRKITDYAHRITARLTRDIQNSKSIIQTRQPAGY